VHTTHGGVTSLLSPVIRQIALAAPLPATPSTAGWGGRPADSLQVMPLQCRGDHPWQWGGLLEVRGDERKWDEGNDERNEMEVIREGREEGESLQGEEEEEEKITSSISESVSSPLIPY
jgi:hypothetical protein